MTETADRLFLCQQMLGDLGTRSTITSISPPDGSTEAFYCNLFYDTTLQQVLRAAHWNFAGRSDTAALWKALPGTPENPVPQGYSWSNRNPAPPWLYSYAHKTSGIMQIRRVWEGPSSDLSGAPFSFGGGAAGTNFHQLASARFEVAVDAYDRAGQLLNSVQSIGPITIVAPGSGYRPGDFIVMTGDPASLMGQPVTLNVLTADVNGGVVQTGMTDPGTFAGAAVSLTQTATTGSGGGFSCGATLVPNPDPNRTQKVILTNARNIIIDYTTQVVNVAQYDAGFQDAFMLAMEGKLALALLGDKAMYKAKLEEANQSIIEARVRDGNEGLTIQDHVPDWLQVRGVGSMTPVDRYFPAYGPLFAV